MLNQQLIGEIIALGAIVFPVSQAVKKWLKAEGVVAIVISAVVTILLVLWRTLSVQPYDWAKFVILTLGVFLEANGIYHFGSYAIGKAVQRGQATKPAESKDLE